MKINFFHLPAKAKINLFLSFFSINLVGKIFSIILIPILTRLLGIENYGSYILILTYYNFFLFLIDFGTTNLSPKKFIELNKTEFKIYASNIIILKSILYVFVCIIIFVLFLINKISFSIFLVLCIGCIGGVLSTEWIYHGQKSMRFPAQLILLKEILRLFIIISLGDLLNTIYAIAVYILLNFIYYLILIYQKRNFLNLKLFSKKILMMIFNENMRFFTSRIFTSLFSKYNLLVISLFLQPYQLAVYSIISKIIFTITDLVRPLNNTLYPYLVENLKDNLTLFKKTIVKQSKLIFVLFTIPVPIIFVFDDIILSLFIEKKDINENSLLVLSIMAISIPFQSLTSFLSNTLIIKGKLNVILVNTLLTSLLGLFLVYFFGVLFESLIITIFIQLFISIFSFSLFVREISK